MMFDEQVHRTMLLGHWMDKGAGIITPCARAAEFPSNMAQRVNKIIDARRRHDTVDLAFMTQTSDSGLVCVGDPISRSGTVPVSDGRRRGPQVRSGPVFQGFPGGWLRHTVLLVANRSPGLAPERSPHSREA